ncbi:hypothetical protein [Amycolatopsis thermoflava]
MLTSSVLAALTESAERLLATGADVVFVAGCKISRFNESFFAGSAPGNA